MTMEEDKFPVGMRVLVVDDDSTCLRLMEGLLHKCQYHVTTTNNARDALRLLKDKKKKFDIVISDVQMPEIDGFNLLQLVGLEMDLPVIMLSAYGEAKNVMKGIKYGACDFLVKPVRIQELQNIWQHVVRKNKSLMRRSPSASSEHGERARGPSGNGADADARLDAEDNPADHDNDNDLENDDESGGSGRENEEPSTTKKTRLFWSVDLHQKFVDAVNQLGPDKAFPKKILDLMNVEGLTREKVASHLQKYRLYLKKMQAGSSQGANRMLGGFGAEETHMRSLGLGGGYGVFRTLAGGPPRFPIPGANSSLSHQMFGRLNTTAGLSMRALASSAMLQNQRSSSHFPNSTSNSLTTVGKCEPLSSPTAHHNASLFSPSLMQQNKASLLYPSPTSMVTGNLSQNSADFGNQSSLNVNPPNINGAPQGIGCAAPLMGSLQSPIPSHSSPHNSFPVNVSDNGASQANAYIQDTESDPLDIFCGITSLEESKENVQSQDGMAGASSFSNHVQQPHSWPDHRPDYILNSCNLTSASSSLITPAAPFNQTLRHSGNNVVGPSPFSLEGVAPHLMLQVDDQKPSGDSSLIFSEDFLLDDTRLLGGSTQNNSEYLEDIVGRFLKQESGGTGPEEEDFDLDNFF